MRLLAVVLLLACASPATAQNYTDYVRLRPTFDDATLPRGGQFVAGFNGGEASTFDRVSFAYEEGGEEQDLLLYEKCGQLGGCTYRSRFPFGEPAQEFVWLHVVGALRPDPVLGVQVDPYPIDEWFGLPVGRRDDTPPTGLDSVVISFDDIAPSFLTTPEWLYYVRVTAPDLRDDTGVALLELYDVTEGDRVLAGQEIPLPALEGEYALQARIDLPETDERCYQLVATDLGGNSASGEPQCFEVVLNEGCSHITLGHCTRGQSPAWPSALAVLLALQLAKRRRAPTGKAGVPMAAS